MELIVLTAVWSDHPNMPCAFTIHIQRGATRKLYAPEHHSKNASDNFVIRPGHPFYNTQQSRQTGTRGH